jgi:tetratricopeptide (TPR) repeat protein
MMTLLLCLSGCASIYRNMKAKRDAAYTEGIALYHEKRFYDARKKFEIVLSIDPDHEKAVQYHKRTGAYIKRLEQQQRVVEQQKMRQLRKIYARAMDQKKRRNYDAALDLFLSIQNEDPYFEDTADQIDTCREKLAWKYSRLVDEAERLKENREHLKAYQTALQAKKYNPDGREADGLLRGIDRDLDKKAAPLLGSAEAHYKKNEFRQARAAYERAVAIKPWDEKARDGLSRCDRMIKIDDQFREAMKQYRKRDYYAAYAGMLAVNRQEKNYNNCEKHIVDLKVLLQKNVGVYYNNGVRQYEQNRFQAAITEFNRVLMIEPGHEKARYYRERAMAKLETQKSLGR